MAVLALALHEHDHVTEAHNHNDGFRAVLHGHTHEGSADHDHELTAPLRARRSAKSPSSHVVVYMGYDSASRETKSVGSAITCLSTMRDESPPSYLMHCVLLT
jgi:hypothetical protein